MTVQVVHSRLCICEGVSVRGSWSANWRRYLETALEDRPGSSSRVREHNRIRQSFKAL
jgi:hypothetical protein